MITLSTHVLDTARGMPAEGLSLQIERLTPMPDQLGLFTTNADGRVPGGLLSPEQPFQGRIAYASKPATISGNTMETSQNSRSLTVFRSNSGSLRMVTTTCLYC